MPRRRTLLAAPLLLAGCGRPTSNDTNVAEILRGDNDGAYPLVTAPRPFIFPDDHGPHREYRHEWWYITGNLATATGRGFGFELTLFRFALHPGNTDGASAWRTNQAYMGHFAVSDIASDQFHAASRFAREALEIAGARARPARVWLDNWRIVGLNSDGAPFRIAADADFGAIRLDLETSKPVVLQGDAGYSPKSAERGNATYYYSMTRLAAAGTVTLAEQDFQVSGSAWLDREWGSSALSRQQVGWDWFALQFDDGSELMLYQLRRDDGSADPFSQGVFVAPDGTKRGLQASEFTITHTRTWRSPHSGRRYPLAWRIALPSLALNLEIQPRMDDQELNLGISYWEGAVDIRGDRSGVGYVELTGYA